jgi:cytoskeletal protein CcmA (bactofilin family)
VRGTGDVRVDGRIEGDVTLSGEMSVGASGVVLAAIEATRLDVEGHVRGNVVAQDEVAVRAGGLLEGDVRAQRIAIDDGGSLVGGIDMDFELPPARGVTS